LFGEAIQLCQGHHQQKTLSFGTRILDVKADGYGPSIKLGIWSLSANGHFDP